MPIANDKIMSSLQTIDDRIEKKQSELSELKEKKKTLETKILQDVMREYDLKIEDIINIANNKNATVQNPAETPQDFKVGQDLKEEKAV